MTTTQMRNRMAQHVRLRDDIIDALRSDANYVITDGFDHVRLGFDDAIYVCHRDRPRYINQWSVRVFTI